MAKKQQDALKTAKNETFARIKRTEAYAETIRLLFARCVNEILALQKTLPKLGEGEMYSFDGDSIRVQSKVEELLRRLASAATMAAENGVQVEWEKANASCDALLQSCFGKKAMKDVQFSAWRKRNTDAMRAFQRRTDDGGMKLSDKIWTTTRQLREEMEVAMTLGIGEGESAADMSRRVRKYLNDPDLMFRRFRYKAGEREVTDYDENGNPIGTHTEVVYGRKWKKKVKGEDGRVRWVDYDKDSYKVGRGNYKSSARNAMRVTRTETNMAYRQSDQTRWNQMDFVLGVRIELSRSHPKKDICDKLAGDYPKDFKFEGWHPQCFCVMTPILMDEDEMAKMSQALLKGEAYTPKGKRITSYPQGFKDWVASHQDEIQDAHDRGTDPYFIRHNFSKVEKIWHPEEEKTALQVAEERHAARTEQQVSEIRNRFMMRQKTKRSADTLIKDFEDFSDVDTTALQEAYKRADWDAVRKESVALAVKKRAILNESRGVQHELDGISDLAPYIKDANDAIMSGTLAEVMKTKNKLQQYKKWLLGLQHVDNPIAAAKVASMQSVVAINDSVDKKLHGWSHLSLAEQKAQLEKEIGKWADDAKYGLKTKYPDSWKISQDAYMKKLTEVKTAIEWQNVKDSLKALKAYMPMTKSKLYPPAVAKVEIAIANGDLWNAKIAATEAMALKTKLEGILAKRMAASKKGGTESTTITFDDDAYSDERVNKATWHTNKNDARDDFFHNAVETWAKASHEEKVACTRYTEASGYVTKFLRGIKGYYEDYESYAKLAQKDSELITAYIARSRISRDIWVKRDERAAFTTYKFGIDVDALIAAEIRGDKANGVQRLVGRTGVDESFMSCGTSKDAWFSGTGGDNKFGQPRVCLNIYCPKGTMMTYADAFNRYTTGYTSSRVWDGKKKNSAGECEIFMQRGTQMRVTKAEYDPNSDKLFVDVYVIGQRCPDFEIEYVSGEGYKASYK